MIAQRIISKETTYEHEKSKLLRKSKDNKVVIFFKIFYTKCLKNELLSINTQRNTEDSGKIIAQITNFLIKVFKLWRF